MKFLRLIITAFFATCFLPMGEILAQERQPQSWKREQNQIINGVVSGFAPGSEIIVTSGLHPDGIAIQLWAVQNLDHEEATRVFSEMSVLCRVLSERDNPSLLADCYIFPVFDGQVERISRLRIADWFQALGLAERFCIRDQHWPENLERISRDDGYSYSCIDGIPTTYTAY